MNISIFRTIRGRQVISLWASRIFESSAVKRVFGLNLVAAVFVAGVITPQADNLLSKMQIEGQTQSTPVAANITTKTTLEMPLVDFRLSQTFTYYHPGIDMVAPESTPIYAIESGDVEFAGNVFFGFGKNVVIRHKHDLKSLYAHMSQVNVKNGQQIERGQLIGKVGSTGWSSGNHLHLEIYHKGVPTNPLEILPIKTEDVKWDGIVYNQTNRPPQPTPLP